MVYSKDQIIEFFEDLIIEPRLKFVKWSKITNQTATLRIGYPGQHLASLVTGVKGEKTGARGNDLADGSEVKSCSRVDPKDTCKDCKSAVLRQEKTCSKCESNNIRRNNDSKWLFTIRNEDELRTLLDNPYLNRILLVIDYYLNFDSGDYNDIQIQIFEIWPKEERHKRFREIITNYYNKIYLEHKKLDSAKTPAPKNFWPFTYQFYLCNPIKIFEAVIYNAYSNPKLEIKEWIKPDVDRNNVLSVMMPSKILKNDEIITIWENASPSEIKRNLIDENLYDKLEESIKNQRKLKEISSFFVYIDEKLRSYLDLRDTDKIAPAKTKWRRASS